ncbi:MAG: hypothetical protein M3450_14220, partial [Actinomycetota bacterium]|nr:hypothetical protein [Actinomycetota bacterium]
IRRGEAGRLRLTDGRFTRSPARDHGTSRAREFVRRSFGRPDQGDELGLDLTLHRPPGSGPPAMLGMIKVLVDGVVSALHRHDGSQLELLAERLSGRLAVPADHVARLLTGNAAVLGTRRLLWPYREFVQWNPADDAIASLRVGTMPSSTWLLSGRLTKLAGRTSHPD